VILFVLLILEEINVRIPKEQSAMDNLEKLGTQVKQDNTKIIKNKNTTQYVLGITMGKQAHIT
jgi:hypothetical protein